MAYSKRHIQDFSDAETVEPHWGYVGRVLPCTNDAGSCAYLDSVYWAHDVSMLYSAILWAVIGGILIVWIGVRLLRPRAGAKRDGEGGRVNGGGVLYQFYEAVAAWRRRWGLREAWPRVFGHASTLQVTILAVLLGYLLVFSFIGITWKTWITPVKNTSLHNTRTALGPWSDRIGVLAFALTPLTVALSTRENLLSLITGIPNQHFMFLHRWTGRIIYIQSALHTAAWTIIEAKLYQPQPMVYRMFIQQQYMIFGCVAMFFLTFIFAFSLSPVIRWTGYEFFRKTHYVVAMLYLGACWGHWQQLACWMIASLGIFGLDRGTRLLRTVLIHLGKKDGMKGVGFRAAQASLRTFIDDEATVVRLEFEHPHSGWGIGQHFFLCFPDLTIWQSHPFTPASVPMVGKTQKHVYIVRALGGETRRLAELAAVKSIEGKNQCSTPVILSGPNGKNVFADIEGSNVLAVAGGTGISFVLPIVVEALQRAKTSGSGAVQLVWIIRKIQNVEWVAEELAQLRSKLAERTLDFQIKIFVTRNSPVSSPVSSAHNGISEKEIQSVVIGDGHTRVADLIKEVPGFSMEYLSDHHPNLKNADGSCILEQWLERGSVNGGRNHVLASGPANMGRDLRIAVAAKNDGAKVLKGDFTHDVAFYWDDRFS